MPACDAKSGMFASEPTYQEVNDNFFSTDNTPDIASIFSGKSVLITGATGFIGKVLVEKILRCCPEVHRLYLLVRTGRKGDSIEQRLEQMATSKLFDKLRESQPNFKDKLVPIQADLLQPKLGLSNADITTLQANVSIVFHVAATIKFDEILRLSMQLNVLAVRMLLELCRGMDLQSFVHISTAYSNCTSKHIEEKVYPPAIDPYRLLDVVSLLPDDVIAAMTPSLLGEWPNTYTYTKALAETVVIKESVGMPVCIVRPSIVGASWKDPFPGWIDNLAGATGLIVASGKGLLRSMLCNKEMVVDLTPVDFVVNTIVTAAWHTAVTRPKKVPVIHSVSSPVKPFKWKHLSQHALPWFKKMPYEQPLRSPHTIYTENRTLFTCLSTIGAKVPCYIVDTACRLQGKKERMMRIYDALHRAIDTLVYFTNNEWQWDNHTLNALHVSMNKQDRQTFFIDLQTIDWGQYVRDYITGAKEHVLKEDMTRIPVAKRQVQRMRYLERTLALFLVIFVGCIVVLLYSYFTT